MDIADARYEVAQILAECRERKIPLFIAVIAVARFFEKHDLEPPVSILDGLGEDFPQPRVFH